MDRIVLEVDDNVGKIYRSLSAKGKQRFGETISLMVKKTTTDATRQDFIKILDDIGIEAKKNGLTDELLQKLLASND